jgi:hypothetical protein
MDALHGAVAATSQWLAGQLFPIIALVVAFVTAFFVVRVASRPGSAWRMRRGTAAATPTDAAGAQAVDAAGDSAGQAPGSVPAQEPAESARIEDLRSYAERLERENRLLEQALALRGRDIDVLTARMAEAAARDREELVRLQDELEGDHRLGREKARLIRSLEAELARAHLAFRQSASERERQRVSMSALQAALNHAKRAQASTEGRLAQLREQLRQQATPAGALAGSQRIVERIIEIPVETIVYRDREVPVEVPIEVPVGFTVLETPPAAGLRPRYSENRPPTS